MKKANGKQKKNLLEEARRLNKELTEPNELDLLDDFSTISLWRLCMQHETTDDRKIKSVLEDLFAVCTNQDFNETVREVRKRLVEQIGIPLPTKNRQEIASFRAKAYSSKKWSLYQEELEYIRSKHGLSGEAFDKNDPFDLSNFKFAVENMQSLIKGDADIFEVNENIEGMALEREAEKWVTHEALDDSTTLNTLENIIFYNDPLYTQDGIPHSNRGGFLRLKTNPTTGEPYIEGKFYLRSTKDDMMKAIDTFYEFMAKDREKLYGIKIAKDSHKANLAEWYRIYQLKQAGKSLAGIASALEKETGTEDISLDKIRVTVGRIEAMSSRFSSKRTE